MLEDHNSFKDNHEELTAKKFIALYNKIYRTNFELIERSEAPDFRAMDKLTQESLLQNLSAPAPSSLKEHINLIYRAVSGRVDCPIS